MLPDGVTAVGIFLGGLLALAAAHKARLLLQNRGASAPLIAAVPWRRRHATWLLVTTAGVEATTAAMLFALRPAGYFMVTALMLVYTIEVARLRISGPCGCFGFADSNSSNRRLVTRNLLLLMLSGLAVLALNSGTEPAPLLTPNTVAIATLMASPLVAGMMLRATAMSQTTSPADRTGGGGSTPWNARPEPQEVATNDH